MIAKTILATAPVSDSHEFEEPTERQPTTTSTALAVNSSAYNPDSTDEPETMRQKAESTIWSCLDKFLEENDDQSNTSNNKGPDTTTQVEIDQFLLEKRIQHTDDPTAWWKWNHLRLPKLAAVAWAYLSTPPTSVPSEPLFSTAGNIIADNHTRLLPDNAERLMFFQVQLTILS